LPPPDLRLLELPDDRKSASNARHAHEAARPASWEDCPLVDREHALMQQERGAEFGHFDARHLVVGTEGTAALARTLRSRRLLHFIFMSFIASPADPLPPLGSVAPRPATENSTGRFPACLNVSVALSVSALTSACLSPWKHEVIVARRQRNLAVGRNFEAIIQPAHRHHVAFHAHFVNLRVMVAHEGEPST
jgi:hypothetical protein